MGLFKEIFCKECGEKTTMLTRKKIIGQEYLCSKCIKGFPNMIKECLSGYTYEDFLELKEYMHYSDTVLNRVFRETHCYQNLHLDQDNGLLYLSDESPRVYIQVGNVELFQLTFEPEKVKEGVLDYKLKGQERLQMIVRKPYISYDKIVDMFAKTKAERNILGTKAKYVNPKGVDEFVEALNKSNTGLNL